MPPELTSRHLSQHPGHPSAERSPLQPVLIILIILLPLSLSSSTGAMPGRITSPPCAVCGRTIQVRLDGKMKTHGPQAHHCPGSRELPANTSSLSPPEPNSSIVSLSPQVTRRGSLQQVPTPSVAPTSPPSINPGCFNGRILKRIPRGSRLQLAQKLTSILKAINTQNDLESWERLILFPRRCLAAPKRGGHR